MYERKTTDVYELQGNYGNGWEYILTEETMSAAKKRKKEYSENEGIPLRIVKKRVKKEVE